MVKNYNNIQDIIINNKYFELFYKFEKFYNFYKVFSIQKIIITSKGFNLFFKKIMSYEIQSISDILYHIFSSINTKDFSQINQEDALLKLKDFEALYIFRKNKKCNSIILIRK